MRESRGRDENDRAVTRNGIIVDEDVAETIPVDVRQCTNARIPLARRKDEYRRSVDRRFLGDVDPIVSPHDEFLLGIGIELTNRFWFDPCTWHRLEIDDLDRGGESAIPDAAMERSIPTRVRGLAAARGHVQIEGGRQSSRSGDLACDLGRLRTLSCPACSTS